MTIPDETARGILRRLLEKTRTGKVNWQPNEGSSVQPASGLFVLLPESSISLEFESPVADPDRYILTFRNSDDFVVKRLTVEEGDPDWEAVASLLDEAMRQTLGTDRVLRDIEGAIYNNEVVGRPRL